MLQPVMATSWGEWQRVGADGNELGAGVATSSIHTAVFSRLSVPHHAGRRGPSLHHNNICPPHGAITSFTGNDGHVGGDFALIPTTNVHCAPRQEMISNMQPLHRPHPQRQVHPQPQVLSNHEFPIADSRMHNFAPPPRNARSEYYGYGNKGKCEGGRRRGLRQKGRIRMGKRKEGGERRERQVGSLWRGAAVDLGRSVRIAASRQASQKTFVSTRFSEGCRYVFRALPRAKRRYSWFLLVVWLGSEVLHFIKTQFQRIMRHILRTSSEHHLHAISKNRR